MERQEWQLLGVAIGTATGWDMGDEGDFVLYDFVPKDGIALPSGDVAFEITKGWAVAYAEDGKELNRVSILEALR